MKPILIGRKYKITPKDGNDFSYRFSTFVGISFWKSGPRLRFDHESGICFIAVASLADKYTIELENDGCVPYDDDMEDEQPTRRHKKSYYERERDLW